MDNETQTEMVERVDPTIAPLTYKVECLDCGAVSWGDPDMGADWDMEYHRDHHCPTAAFEVVRRE